MAVPIPMITRVLSFRPLVTYSTTGRSLTALSVPRVSGHLPRTPYFKSRGTSTSEVPVSVRPHVVLREGDREDAAALISLWRDCAGDGESGNRANTSALWREPGVAEAAAALDQNFGQVSIIRGAQASMLRSKLSTKATNSKDTGKLIAVRRTMRRRQVESRRLRQRL